MRILPDSHKIQFQLGIIILFISSRERNIAHIKWPTHSYMPGKCSGCGKHNTSLLFQDLLHFPELLGGVL